MRYSIYHNSKNEKQYKAATGLSIFEFEALFLTFEKLYFPKEGNPYSPQKSPVLTDKREALFFILHYYKAYPTLQNMGTYFGFSDCAVSQYLELIKPILKHSLSQNSTVCSRLFSNQSEFDEIFKNVETVIIDVSEVPTERPVNQEIQENRYSGKKNFIL
jgi:hypothetical protein